jgi:hypothetical protein
MTGGTFLSYYSVADFGRAPNGALHFPGRAAVPRGSAGYVRSSLRARDAALVRDGRQSAGRALPWRDYPAETLTSAHQVLDVPFRADSLLLGCRNVLNEWGHQLRLAGHWWRRAGDPPVDRRWPVLAALPDGLRFLPASEAEETAGDLLTGVPLVIGGIPSSRPFLMANCSDVAHLFDVHPAGLTGPSPEAWLELSDAWETAHRGGVSEAELAASLHEIAARHGAAERRYYLHSIIAETPNSGIVAFALTGSLEGIAAHLAAQWNVSNAILLDNGGSVGWLYCPRDERNAALLVGAPNRRDRGTAFLSIETRGFPLATVHNAIKAETE